MNSSSPPIQSFLEQRARQGASAEHLADVILAVWRQIGSALAPVIGQRGVSALYRRCLHRAGASHPWMAAARGTDPAEMELSALKAALVRQESMQVAAAGAALLLSFHELIESLIGPGLSRQLLGPVWTNFFSGPAAQDPSP